MFDLDRWNEIWETINRNRKRSIMTAFGVFWGIFMLTVMAGIGLGLERQMRGQLGNLAVNSCFFFGGKTSIPYQGLRAGRWWQFENEDVDAVKKQVGGVRYATGFIWGAQYTFTRNDKKGTYQLMGYAPEYWRINPQPILFGRYVNDIDMTQQRKVCVIGTQVWKDLFPGREDPVGSTIRMNNMYLTVVGVIDASQGINFSRGENTVIIPFATLQQMYNKGNKFDGLAVAGYDNTPIVKLEAELKSLMCSRHQISPDDTKAINGFNLGERFEKFSNLFTGIAVLTWIVGIGTLLAGIVGISNIMLVVVRERTQEIGIRRALGAPPSKIISQIMSESFVLTFIAGIGGLALAVAGLSVAESIISANSMADGGSPFSAQISFNTAMAATSILIAGGLLAGIIPAVRAIRIKPVDAIREE